MVSDFKYHSIDETQGEYHVTDIDYPALMHKHIPKHSTTFQPLFEALSNSFEATKDENDEIVVSMNFSGMHSEFPRELYTISVSDTGHGFCNDDLTRIKRLFDDSKGLNNFGSGRVQFLHFFDKTDIHTVYEENGVRYMRRLVMSLRFYKLHHSVLWIGNPVEVEKETPTGTTISFYTLLSKKDSPEYNELTCSSFMETVKSHYLGRLCMHAPHCPKIKFEEYIMQVHNEAEDCFILNSDLPELDYSEDFSVNYTKLGKDGKIKNLQKKEVFTLKSFKIPPKAQRSNEVKVMSKGEEVGNSGMRFSLITNSPRVDSFSRLFLLSSPYLTSKDTDLRGNLALASRDSITKLQDAFNEEPEEILIDDIERTTTENISKHYVAIRDSKENAEAKLKELVERYSLDEKTVNTLIKNPAVPPITVFKEVFSREAEEKAKSYDELNRVFDSLRELDPTSKSFLPNLKNKIEKVSSLIPEINRMELLNYTSKRKVVLLLLDDILKKRLYVQHNQKKKKKANTETLLHQLLFPKKSDNPLNSNLWIINEDYIHYKGLSEYELDKVHYDGKTILRDDLSEEELERLNEYRIQFDKRPDILLFPQERKCVIIELKSTGVDISKHINQVKIYAALLREYAKDEFLIDEFYCYLIGEDFTFDEVQRAESKFNPDFTNSYLWYEDANGVYGGEKRTKAKIRYEIYKYSTLLKKADLRNKIFTDKISVEVNTDGNN